MVAWYSGRYDRGFGISIAERFECEAAVIGVWRLVLLRGLGGVAAVGLVAWAFR